MFPHCVERNCTSICLISGSCAGSVALYKKVYLFFSNFTVFFLCIEWIAINLKPIWKKNNLNFISLHWMSITSTYFTMDPPFLFANSTILTIMPWWKTHPPQLPNYQMALKDPRWPLIFICSREGRDSYAFIYALTCFPSYRQSCPVILQQNSSFNCN